MQQVLSISDTPPVSASQKRYRVPVYTIQLVRERSIMIEESITGPAAVVAAARSFLDNIDRESLLVVLLDTKSKIIGINTVSIGDLNSSIIHPREVFKPAILCNACSIVLVHNHPSGDPTPSPEDVSVTLRMITAGDILGVTVLDHVVIGESSHVSLKERGLI